MRHKKLKKKLELCIIEKRQLNDMIRDYRYQEILYNKKIDELTEHATIDDKLIESYRAEHEKQVKQIAELEAKVLRQAESLIMGR